MIAYFFKFDYDETLPSGWMGLALARDKASLFWEIDQFGDPYSCVIQTATMGGYCVFVDESEDDIDDTQHETGWRPRLLDRDWRKPNWDGVHQRNLEKIDKRQAKQLGEE